MVPPIVDTRQLGMLSVTSPGVPADILTIAVVINRQGTVESVRAVNVPQNLAESIQLTNALSAVKSWRFHPATKRGVPVRYREIVPIAVARGPARR